MSRYSSVSLRLISYIEQSRVEYIYGQTKSSLWPYDNAPGYIKDTCHFWKTSWTFV